MMQMHEENILLLQLVLLYGAGILWVTFPLWWPALKVLRQRDRLPHPATYTLVCALLSSGLVTAVALVVILPVRVAGIYFTQQLIEAGIPFGHLLGAADTAVDALTIPLAVLQLVSTWWVSRALVKRWRSLCGHR